MHRAVLVGLAVAIGTTLTTTGPDPSAATTAAAPGLAATSVVPAALATGADAGGIPPVDRPHRTERILWEPGTFGPRNVAPSPRPMHADPTPHDDQRQGHDEGPIAPEGFQVAGGTSGAGDGPVVTFTVELEDEVDADVFEVVEIVEAALYDPRSWVHDHTLERIDDPEAADIRVVVATPDRVDALCAEAGLRTGGIYSCWNGRFAALNSLRWSEGAAGFGDDLDAYRTYLVNHEFGHGLGYGHVGCPAAGERAPVMMQQSKGTGGCEPNGWPYPELSPLTDD